MTAFNLRAGTKSEILFYPFVFLVAFNIIIVIIFILRKCFTELKIELKDRLNKIIIHSVMQQIHVLVLLCLIVTQEKKKKNNK